MSDDWQVGDKALCIRTPDDRRNRAAKGVIYTVTKVFKFGLAIGLTFAEIEHPNAPGYNAKWFRKIKPDTHEPCEEEFQILLKLSKKRANV